MAFWDTLKAELDNPTPWEGHDLLTCNEWIQGDIDTPICPCGKWFENGDHCLPIEPAEWNEATSETLGRICKQFPNADFDDFMGFDTITLPNGVRFIN
jgi:hypothetical protein